MTQPSLSSRVPRFLVRRTQYLLDLSVLAAAFLSAYLVRFEWTLPPHVRLQMVRQLPLVVLIQLIALSMSGVYAIIWRYVGLSELQVFGRAALSAFVPLLAMRLLLPDTLQDFRVPLSVLLIDAVVAFGGVLALRVTRRLYYER